MKKGTVYESAPVHQAVFITKPVSTPKRSFFDRVAGLMSKNPTEKVVFEPPRDKDRLPTQELITYLSEFDSNTLPANAKALVIVTAESLRLYIEDESNKEVGPTVVKSIQQLLKGLDVVDRLNHSKLDLFYRSSQKKSEQAAMSALKTEVLSRVIQMDPNFKLEQAVTTRIGPRK